VLVYNLLNVYGAHRARRGHDPGQIGQWSQSIQALFALEPTDFVLSSHFDLVSLTQAQAAPQGFGEDQLFFFRELYRDHLNAPFIEIVAFFLLRANCLHSAAMDWAEAGVRSDR
jgi:hypothetical protein